MQFFSFSFNVNEYPENKIAEKKEWEQQFIQNNARHYYIHMSSLSP